MLRTDSLRWKIFLWILLPFGLLLLVYPAVGLFGRALHAVEEPELFGGTDPQFWVYEASPHRLGMMHSRASGQPLEGLPGGRRHLLSRGIEPQFIMNGGMYHQDLSPVGLYVQEGQTLSPLNLDRGFGNFFLQPNGVFFLTQDGRPGILPSWSYPPMSPVKFATQSGPMLLIGGEINGRFRPGSSSRRIRNAVGVSPEGRVWFILSRREVNMYETAYKLQSLGAYNGLYLDGTVSNAYTPEEGYLRLPTHPSGVMIYEQ